MFSRHCIENMVQSGALLVALNLLRNQFRVDYVKHSCDVSESMYEQVCCCNPSLHLISHNK